MKKLAALLLFAFCFVVSKPGYSKPIVRCNPANGAVRIDLTKGKNLPMRFGRIGATKDGVIIWASSLDARTRTLKKVASDANGTSPRRIKGTIGPDKGRFYVRWKNGSTVPIDSLSFRLMTGVENAGDGDLVMCGYTPPEPSSPSEGVPAVTASQSMPPPDDLRDWRYCEVIPVFQSGLTLNVEVYNTIGLNDCPADLWAKLDAGEMAQQYGAKSVKLNGPRYWVINKAMGEEETAAGKIVDFGGIEMKLVATLQTKLWEGTVGDEFYKPNEVYRTTTWVYRAGNMVYELTSPEGDVYMMQSYSQIKDVNLTIGNLETLGARLMLPEGWTYQARRLDADLELKADGLAYVINDDFYNSYQRREK